MKKILLLIALSVAVGCGTQHRQLQRKTLQCVSVTMADSSEIWLEISGDDIEVLHSKSRGRFVITNIHTDPKIGYYNCSGEASIVTPKTVEILKSQP